LKGVGDSRVVKGLSLALSEEEREFYNKEN
jgi:hypothetical protein